MKLGFVNHNSFYYEVMRDSKSNIDLVNHQHSNIVLDNLLKICYAILKMEVPLSQRNWDKFDEFGELVPDLDNNLLHQYLN